MCTGPTSATSSGGSGPILPTSETPYRPDADSVPGKTKPDPYEKRIAVIDRFWEMYNQHPWPKRIDPQAQQMWDEAWIESVSQHYGVEYNGSIIDLDILIRREFKRLRRRTDEILKDLKRMDERDRKRAYRARKKAQQAGKKLVM